MCRSFSGVYEITRTMAPFHPRGSSWMTMLLAFRPQLFLHKSSIFLVFPTLSHYKHLLETCEVNMSQQYGGGSTACFTSLSQCRLDPNTNTLQHSFKTVTQVLSCLSLWPGCKKAGIVKHSCCLALTEDPPNHPCSCYTVNTVSSTFTLSYAPSFNCTDPGLSCKHVKKYLHVPMSIPPPISTEYNIWKVEQR